MTLIPRKRRFVLAAAVANVALIGLPAADAADWTVTSGSASWPTDANWNPAAHPDAVGAVANFPNNLTANRTITVDSGATGFTVGTISFDVSGAGGSTNSLQVGTTGSNLKLDNGGAGVTISTTGNGTGNNTISAALVLNDNVTAVVNQPTTTSATGSLNLTATMSGTGGFTKQGPGTMTFGTGQKTYTGPTVFDTNAGRTRISAAARPQSSSSITVNSGAQLEFITNGTYAMGGPLHLNGTGLAPFPGSIRPTRDVVADITTPVVIDTDTVVHMQSLGPDGSGGPGVISFSGVVSGPGHLDLSAPVVSNFEMGRYALVAANPSWSGGVAIHGGTLKVFDGGALGTGPFAVNANVGQIINTVAELSSGGAGATPATTSGPLSGFIGPNGGTATIRLNGTVYTVNQTADGTYVGALTDGIGGAGTGGFGLSATSTNTLLLTGNLTYSGSTTVQGGRMALGTNLTTSASVTVTGGTVELTPGAGNNRILRTPIVSTSGTGRIDIQDNKLITATPVGTATGGVYDGVTGQIQAGYNPSTAAHWDGANGIVTSQTQAIAGSLTSIGIATAQQAKLLANPSDTAVFGGQTVTGTDTLVMYTYGGDANLDGKINVDDYGRIDSNIGLGTAGWYNGDFNYDGKVNVDDYGIIDSNIGIQGAQFPSGAGVVAAPLGVSAVPEPASLGMLVMGAVVTGAACRRRRR
jgi:autotransporter-associated beta strand protein